MSDQRTYAAGLHRAGEIVREVAKPYWELGNTQATEALIEVLAHVEYLMAEPDTELAPWTLEAPGRLRLAGTGISVELDEEQPWFNLVRDGRSFASSHEIASLKSVGEQLAADLREMGIEP